MHRIDWRHTGRYCLAALCIDFSSGMLLVVLPFAAMEMGAGSLILGILGAARGLAYALACPVSGVLSDRYDRKILITISSAGLLITLIAVANASTLLQLFIPVMFWAIVLSLFWPSLFSWMGDMHRHEQLGKATGALNVSWSSGLMTGGLVAGILYQWHPTFPILLACIPVIIAWFTMAVTSQAAERTPPRLQQGKPIQSAGILISAWLANLGTCSLLGLMSGVFPKLGVEIGVTAGLFGAFMFMLGAGRSIIFFLSFWYSDWLRSWRISAVVQAVAAFMIATVAYTSAHWWLTLIFITVGIALGITYYRSLYVSLEGGGATGLKSSLHEASLLGGVLIGSVGGGAIAHTWGLRSPYAPIAAVTGSLLIVQIVVTSLSTKKVSQ